jgi:hypothetical protein
MWKQAETRITVWKPSVEGGKGMRKPIHRMASYIGMRLHQMREVVTLVFLNTAFTFFRKSLQIKFRLCFVQNEAKELGSGEPVTHTCNLRCSVD